VDVVKQLLAFNEQYDLKRAPYLTSSVLKPTNFEKMNVSLAFKFFNNNVAAAINYLISKKLFPESHHTTRTSWFIKLVATRDGRYTSMLAEHRCFDFNLRYFDIDSILFQTSIFYRCS
jgi:hypothetical protein